MKANIFLSCISVLLALLLGYWAFSIAQGQENDIVCGVCSTVCFIATLLPLLAAKHESTRIAVNIRVLAGVFFLIFVVTHFCFALFGVKMPYYVIVNGLLLLIFIALLYSLSETKDI